METAGIKAVFHLIKSGVKFTILSLVIINTIIPVQNLSKNEYTPNTKAP